MTPTLSIIIHPLPVLADDWTHFGITDWVRFSVASWDRFTLDWTRPLHVRQQSFRASPTPLSAVALRIAVQSVRTSGGQP